MKEERSQTGNPVAGSTKNSEQKVLLSPKKFRALVENNDAIIAIVDEQLNSIFRSAAAARITGWTHDEFQKIAATDYVHPADAGMVAETIAEAIANPGKTIRLTTRVRHKDGYYVWLEGTVTNMLHDPDVQGIITNMRDISERKDAEEKVNKARRLYYFISQVNQMIVRTKAENELFTDACNIAVDMGKFRMAWIGLVNDDRSRIVPVMYAGEQKDQLTGIKSISLSGDAENNVAALALQDGNYVVYNDLQITHGMQPWKTPGLNKDYHSAITLPIMKFGKLVGAFSLYADTPHFFNAEEIELLQEATGDLSFALENFAREQMRRKAEEAVIESERRYQTLTEVSPVGIFHTDATGYTTYVNPRWCQISGLSKDEALGNGWLSAVHPADREMLQQGWEEATKASEISRSEYRFMRPDGSLRWVIGEAIPERDSEQKIVGYVGTTTDITERKKAEEQIEKIHKEKETVLNRINDAMVSVDREWRYTFLNDAALATHPGGREATIGCVIWDVHPEMIGTIFWDKYHESMSTGKVIDVESYYAPMETWFSVKIYPSHDGLTIFYTNITQRKKAEEKIINNEKKFKALIENSIDGLTVISADDKILDMSPSGRKILACTKDTTAAELRSTLVHPDDRIIVQEAFDAIRTDPQKIKTIEYRHQMPGGSYTWLECSFRNLLHEPFINAIVMNYRDISERVKAQEKITEATSQLRKLTAHLQHVREEERKRIGREIHDELGQQLTAIKMDVAWLDKKMPAEEVIFKSKLKNIIELLDGSNKSIRRILSELRPGLLDDYGLLEALEWLGNQFTANTGVPVHFTTNVQVFKSSEPVVTCIFRIYQEALTNITRYANASKVFTSLNIHDNIIVVSVADNGKGFAPESVESRRSFGILGMKERVISLGGEFELRSSPGKGTTIMIKLPANQQEINLDLE